VDGRTDGRRRREVRNRLAYRLPALTHTRSNTDTCYCMEPHCCCCCCFHARPVTSVSRSLGGLRFHRLCLSACVVVTVSMLARCWWSRGTVPLPLLLQLQTSRHVVAVVTCASRCQPTDELQYCKLPAELQFLQRLGCILFSSVKYKNFCPLVLIAKAITNVTP